MATTSHSSVPPIDVVWPILIATASIVVVASLAVFFSFVRRVELSPADLTFAVRFRRVRVSWQDLVPPRQPFFITISFRYRRDGVVQENDGLAVSRPLARVILGHPSCPKFRLDSRIWSSLGMPAPAVAH
jgi:hypothetical protein